MKAAYLALDQGTTSSRAIIFDLDGQSVCTSQKEFTQYFPHDGWVEHDPEEIWNSSVEVVRAARQAAEQQGYVIKGIGITNQRETTIIWDKATGTPIYNAIVWQDRRTAATCRELVAGGHEALVSERAGLVVDPYFSASKISWILDHVDGARSRAEKGELAFGTVDSFLIWRLTEGRQHITDATNASRTSLMDIRSGEWDHDLCNLFNVPYQMLPEIVECAGWSHQTSDVIGKPLPILASIGDQQGAAVGQGCLRSGQIKSTYGTGCFVILNTGDRLVRSSNRLLTTIGLSVEGQTSYALEGSIFIAGAVIQWLRDGMGLVQSAAETEARASAAADSGLYMVPAFTGLGAPWWAADARGAIYGITRDTGPDDFIRAALDSVAYQTCDLFDAMARDGVRPEDVRVDGGMVANDWFMQRLSDFLNLAVERPRVTETTALGAAMLAALSDGAFASLDDIAESWQLDRRFEPKMVAHHRIKLRSGWDQAVTKTRLSL